MIDRRLGIAWLVALVAALLAWASLTGDGTGLLGLGVFTAMGWSYAILVLALILMLVPAFYTQTEETRR